MWWGIILHEQEIQTTIYITRFWKIYSLQKKLIFRNFQISHQVEKIQDKQQKQMLPKLLHHHRRIGAF